MSSWTSQQKDIINAEGNVYVTASAGTGKTAVVIERVLEFISSGGCIEKILLITFTNAAAGEMKERLFDKLRHRAESAVGDKQRHILSQLQLIDTAQISTIHSFCSKIVRNYFFKAGVSASFRIAHGSEIQVLKTDALQETMEEVWGDDQLADPAAEMLENRNADISSEYSILGQISQVSDFCSSLPEPEKWIESCSLPEENSQGGFAEKSNISRLAFSKILKIYREKFAQKKRTLNVLDYSDLEHFALKILLDEESARQIKSQYRQIYVDEFQDTSGIQNRIIDLLENSNMFLVGDIKQSIYGFRNARPDLFNEKIRKKPEAAKSLSNNFRCRPEIISFANKVFSEIMQPPESLVDYSKDHQLEAAAEFQPFSLPGKPCEQYFITADANAQKKKELTAAFTAEKVRQILSEGKIYDSQFPQTPREIRKSDIAILKKDLKNDYSIYVEQFRRAGIELKVLGRAELKESIEYIDILSMLKYLNNPTDQVALAGVMRSPFYQFTEDQLLQAAILSAGGKLTAQAVEQFAEGSGELAEKCKEFLEETQALREQAFSLEIPELVWKIINHKNYLAFASSISGAGFRRDNLLKLHSLASDYQDISSWLGSASLPGFLDYLEKLTDKDIDAGTPPGGEAVSLMTVHASKGLEFPVVIMPDLEKAPRNNTSQVIVSEKSGLAINSDITENSKTMLYEQIKNENKLARIDEAKRLLYVAVTRAKEKLVLIGAGKQEDKTPEESCWSWIYLCIEPEFISKSEVEKITESFRGQAAQPASSRPLDLKDITARCSITDKIVNPQGGPVKISASQVGHKEFKPSHAFSSDANEEQTQTDPRLKGSAVHLVFERIIKSGRFEGFDYARRVYQELAREKLIDEDMLSSSDLSSICAFFRTSEGRCSLESKSRSEWPFTAYIEAEKLGEKGDHKLIVQGVIDLLIERDNDLQIIDFKTDNVSEEQVRERAEVYKCQLTAYAIAAEKILEKPVSAKKLYFLKQGRLLEI
ncbi:ATP-dependent helicase/nuclease subunit A [Sedimentisphaera cyanobacteriorum]|uniref:DNA 3'-5' helicase n=1 Tax=Sedimentisphaera cyanobacteriorum TaxID=1940790 RepID=A0A1Q2HRD4_9BACT|nr:UvrD-helicase domain-containing protein [Sedimentisphaera cyanobacteriorum]AQQ09960.1 ATP-dependent helicase/nuclease subunit A [Sedimentisphaera cyanobacteriorum]